MRWLRFSLALVILCQGVPAQKTGQEQKKKELYSETFKEAGLDLTVTEVERGQNYSVVRVDLREGSSVGSSMALSKAFCKIAVEMNYKYIAYGKFWEKDGESFQKMYFTNDDDSPIKELLGKDYSKEAQSIFDDVGYMDVEEWSRFLELTLNDETLDE